MVCNYYYETMKKLIGYVIVLTLAFIIPQSVAAQTPPQANKIMKCVSAERCSNLVLLNDPSAQVKCPVMYQKHIVEKRKLDDADGHMIYLKTGTIPKGAHLMECIFRTEGQSDLVDCTTGISSLDRTLFGRDVVSELQSKLGKGKSGSCNDMAYKFNSLTPHNKPETVINQETQALDTVGTREFMWNGCTAENLYRRFFLIYEQTTQQVGEPPVPSGQAGGNNTQPTNDTPGSQSQGTLKFPTPSFIPSPEENVECAAPVLYDPYGRTFDSQSLEPIPNTTVQLDKKRDDGTYSIVRVNEFIGSNLVNPQQTDETGGFTFLLPDGTYTLNPSIAGYDFPSLAGKLHYNAKRIYSDIYPNETGVDIVEKGGAQHRDIPLDPKDGVGKSYPLKLIGYFYDVQKVKNKAVIDGAVTHPFAKVRGYSLKAKSTGTAERYREVGTTQADKLGRFRLEIDQTKFEPDEIFGEFDIEKVDLRTIDQEQPKTQGTTAAVTRRVKPILNYVAGYAYDTATKPLRNATVAVYVGSATIPYYQTKTDTNGFYRIDSTALPSIPYKVQYTMPSGSKLTVETDKIVAQNASYLVSEKINLSSYQGASVQSKTNPAVGTSTNGGSPTAGNSAASEAQPTQQSSNTILIAVILLVLVGTALGLLGIYLYKKNKVNGY
jgi:hypothetical protein